MKLSEKQISEITIEHVVITSEKSFEKLTTALEERLGNAENMDKILGQLKESQASWQQTTQIIEKQLGTSGFAIFGKIEHGVLLSLIGKPKKAVLYLIGNPLLAVQMTQHVLATALYVPFKLEVYEDDRNRTVIVYDRLSSLLSQFHNTEITRIAKIVDKKLEELLAAVI